jgi:DNA invertase Pin-like site-specific DNA recombinase
MGQLIGYARVSTDDQDLGLQLAALRQAGCHDPWIFRDITSGARTRRASRRYVLVIRWSSGAWIVLGGR